APLHDALPISGGWGRCGGRLRASRAGPGAASGRRGPSSRWRAGRAAARLPAEPARPSPGPSAPAIDRLPRNSPECDAESIIWLFAAASGGRPSAAGSVLNFSELFAPIVSDMQAVDAVIRARLDSEVVLIRTIGDYIVGAGGKRMRPAMVLLVAGALGYRGDNHHRLAAVVEFIHTATMLHDDV